MSGPRFSETRFASLRPFSLTSFRGSRRDVEQRRALVEDLNTKQESQTPHFFFFRRRGWEAMLQNKTQLAHQQEGGELNRGGGRVAFPLFVKGHGF